MKNKIYVYPRFPDGKDLGIIRLGGAGLANCMFTAARAYVLHKKYDLFYIDPTWEKFSLGPYLRKEKDKRHYFRFFNKMGINGFRKLYLLNTKPKYVFNANLQIDKIDKPSIIVVKGLGNYFDDIIDHHEEVKSYFDTIIFENKLKDVNEKDLKNTIGIHIRLGDFKSHRRTSINWYLKIIKKLMSVLRRDTKFFVFSDGTDEELKNIISLPNVQRVFFGNAIADIYALSYTKLIIGSASTFSAWGAFLGQKPIIKPKSKYATFNNILIEKKYQVELDEKDNIPPYIYDYLLEN